MTKTSSLEDVDYGLELYGSSISWWPYWIPIYISFMCVLQAADGDFVSWGSDYFWLFLSLVILTLSLLRIRSVFVRVTEKGVLFSDSLLIPQKKFVSFEDIDDVSYKITGAGALFGYGTIYLQSQGRTNILKNIEDCSNVIQEIRRLTATSRSEKLT